MSIVGSEDPLHESSYVLIENLATVNESRYEDDYTEGTDKYVGNYSCMGEAVDRRNSMEDSVSKRGRAVWYRHLAGARVESLQVLCKLYMLFVCCISVEPR